MNKQRTFGTLTAAWNWGETWLRYANLTTPYLHTLTVLRLGDDETTTPPAKRFEAVVWNTGRGER